MKKSCSLLLFTLIAALCFTETASALGHELKYAKKFAIEYRQNNVKLLTDSAGKKFLLVPDGAEIPDDYKSMEDTMLVRTPIKRALLGSTSQVSFLKQLDQSKKLYSTIAAVTTPEADWTDETVKKAMRSGKIKHLSNATGQKPNIEAIIEIAPDIVFPSGMDLGETKMTAQLKNAGIPAVSIADFTEASDEAYLEWVKFYGAFYNMDNEADIAFNKAIENKRKLTEKINSEIKGKGLKRPVVALGFLFNGLVYTQSGSGKFTSFVNNSGGSYAMEKSRVNGSVQIGMEEFFNKCKDADILIYSSISKYTPNKRALIAQNALFAEFKAMKTDNVYIYDKGYYINSAEILEKFEDMVYILQPSLMPGHKLKHYHKLPD